MRAVPLEGGKGDPQSPTPVFASDTGTPGPTQPHRVTLAPELVAPGPGPGQPRPALPPLPQAWLLSHHIP